MLAMILLFQKELNWPSLPYKSQNTQHFLIEKLFSILPQKSILLEVNQNRFPFSKHGWTQNCTNVMTSEENISSTLFYTLFVLNRHLVYGRQRCILPSLIVLKDPVTGKKKKRITRSNSNFLKRSQRGKIARKNPKSKGWKTWLENVISSGRKELNNSSESNTYLTHITVQKFLMNTNTNSSKL